MTGSHKLVQQLLCDGFSCIFGNPGTVEEGFLDAISSYEEFHYITCLQESIAVAMADGYARKKKNAAVVQLHSGVGLGNGIGMLYQSLRGHTPLIVLAGEAGVKYEAMDAQMACNLVDMAKPVTKWAGRVTHKDSLLRTIRKAIKIALTPPYGPVFVALPFDILEQENTEEIIPSVRLHYNACASKEDIAYMAEVLVNAKQPLFLVGDGISNANAQEELGELAELLSARVYGVDHSQYNFNTKSPLFQGLLGHMFGESSKEKVKGADVVLILGTYLFPEVFPCLEEVFPKGTILLHVDLNAYEIAKNMHADLGVIADPKPTIKELLYEIRRIQNELQKENVKKQYRLLEDKKRKERKSFEPQNLVEVFIKYLAENVGDSYVIFDEALTSSRYLEKYFPMVKEGDYFQTRGGSLGVGIPSAIGIKLASMEMEKNGESDKSKGNPETVIVFTGDGGSLYTIQALNAAVRYHIPVKIIILNNGCYRLLKDNIDDYRRKKGDEKTSYPDCFELKPAVDYVMLAKSFGMEDGMKIQTIQEAKEGVEKMLLKKEESFLIDLITE